MSIVVKKGDVNIQNYVEKGGKLKNIYKGPVILGSGTKVDAKKQANKVPSDEVIKAALLSVKDRITVNRLWFAIYRPLVQVGRIIDGDFEKFQELVQSLVIDLPKPIDIRDLQSKMNTRTFQKDVECWDPENAPVSGKTFMMYYKLADDFLKLITIDADDEDEDDEEDEEDNED